MRFDVEEVFCEPPMVERFFALPGLPTVAIVGPELPLENAM
jgi:hypothetical protein